MFDVKTPLSKLHRAVRRVDPATFVAAPGVWAYVDSSDDKMKNIVSTSTDQTQKQILKPVLGNASSSQYESHDISVGSISTIEEVFRATVDTDGYQRTVGGLSVATTVAYAEGDELTVAFKVTSATNATSLAFAKAADIGKLRPVMTNGEVVVARVEKYDATNNLLTYQTMTPYPAASE